MLSSNKRRQEGVLTDGSNNDGRRQRFASADGIFSSISNVSDFDAELDDLTLEGLTLAEVGGSGRAESAPPVISGKALTRECLQKRAYSAPLFYRPSCFMLREAEEACPENTQHAMTL